MVKILITKYLFQYSRPKNPNELTDEENAIVDELLISIQHSTKIKTSSRFHDE